MSVMHPRQSQSLDKKLANMHRRSFRFRSIRRRSVMLLVSEERRSIRLSSDTGVKIDITDDGAVSICGVDAKRAWQKRNTDDPDHRNRF